MRMCSLNVWLWAWGHYCMSTLACACVYFCVHTAAKTGQGHTVAGGVEKPVKQLRPAVDRSVANFCLRERDSSPCHHLLTVLSWSYSPLIRLRYEARTKKPGKTHLLKSNVMWLNRILFLDCDFLTLQILLLLKTVAFSEKKIQDLKALFTSRRTFTDTWIFSFLTLFWKQIYSDWAIPTANKNAHRIHEYSTVYLLPYTCSCVLAVTAACTDKFPSSCLVLSAKLQSSCSYRVHMMQPRIRSRQCHHGLHADFGCGCVAVVYKELN